jgi:hypothetical protein
MSLCKIFSLKTKPIVPKTSDQDFADGLSETFLFYFVDSGENYEATADFLYAAQEDSPAFIQGSRKALEFIREARANAKKVADIKTTLSI